MSSRRLGRGGTAQVGGSPYPTRIFRTHYPLFSLTLSAQRKKLSKKESGLAHEVILTSKIYLRRPEIFLAEYFLWDDDQRYARWISGRFLEKATQKLSINAPLNPNLMFKF